MKISVDIISMRFFVIVDDNFIRKINLMKEEEKRVVVYYLGGILSYSNFNKIESYSIQSTRFS